MILPIHTGDWQQIRELSTDYNNLLEAKDLFVAKVMHMELHPLQRSEAEVRLAMLTGELKRIDATIHYLMFGGDMMPNEIARPLYWQVENLCRTKYMDEIRMLTKEVVVLNVRARQLLSRNIYLELTEEQKKKMRRKKKEQAGEDVVVYPLPAEEDFNNQNNKHGNKI